MPPQINSNSHHRSLQRRRRGRTSSLSAITASLLLVYQCIPDLTEATTSPQKSRIGSPNGGSNSSIISGFQEDRHHRQQRSFLSRHEEDSLHEKGTVSETGDFSSWRALGEAGKKDSGRSQKTPRLGLVRTVRRLKKSKNSSQGNGAQEEDDDEEENLDAQLGLDTEGAVVADEEAEGVVDSVSLGISSTGKGKGGSSGSRRSKNSKGSKASKSEKSSGKGNGNVFDNDDAYAGDDDAATPTAPSSPNASPTEPPSGGNTPTEGNTPTGGDEPTDGGYPSGGMDTPVPSEPPAMGPPSNREPPTLPPAENSSPTEPPVQPRCTIAGDGLFGSQVGLSQELEFAYQLQVVPSVTVSEINLNVLNNIETAIGERVLGRVFDQCFPSGSSPQKRSSNNGNRQLRVLQSGELEGFSTRPRDTVAENVECVNVERVYPCFVISGKVTTYTEQPITDDMVQRVGAALQAAIEAGGLEDADSRVVQVNWRDLIADPLPDDYIGGEETPTAAPVATPANGGTVPIVRNSNDGGGLETWAIALIAVGCSLFACMAYLCLRSSAHEPIFDDDEEANPSESSEDEFADEPQGKEKTPLVTPVYEPPPSRPQAPPEQPPTKDPYRDPYMLSSRSQFQDEPQTGGTSRASSEGSPIEEESEHDESSSDDEDEEDREKSHDQNVARLHAMGPSAVQESGHTSLNLQDTQEPSDVTFEPNSPVKARPTAQDNAMVSPFGHSQGQNSGSQWDQNIFNETADAPMESTSEEFSSEYSEEEVDEEYEIEYVEDEEGLEGVAEEFDDENDDGDDDDDEEESYSDDDDDDDEEEIVMDEPGKTPILPWLAQDDQ